MTKRRKILIFGGAVVLIGLMVLPYVNLLKPTALRIHISDKTWDRITVTTQFVTNSPMVFSPPDEIIVSPISHGPYYIHVEFGGEQNFWIQYFHTDAGARRAVDIYLDGLPANDTVEVRTVAYGDRTIYSNTLAISQTSEEKPVDIQ